MTTAIRRDVEIRFFFFITASLRAFTIRNRQQRVAIIHTRSEKVKGLQSLE